MLRIIGGTHKGRSLLSPTGIDVRPTSNRLREAVFNICQNEIEGAIFLDLFAGSGAMGIEALSRGAAQATFLDESHTSITYIKRNLQQLALSEQAVVMQGDALRLLRKPEMQNSRFSLIFVDPPYHAEEYPQKILNFFDLSSLLEDRGVLFFEMAKKIQIKTSQWQTLRLISYRQVGQAQLLQFQKVNS